MSKNFFKKAVVMFISFVMLITFFPDVSFTVNAAYENTHINTGNQRADIVAIAQTQVGYHEGSLEGTTNGSDNYTKYNVDLYKIEGSYKYMWCQSFIAWCAKQAGVSPSVIKRTAGTVDAMDFFKAQGAWQGRNYTPQSGDIIYFTSSSSNSGYHVGIVESVSGSTINTIEGNYSNKVARHSVTVGGSSIVGYIAPDINPPTWSKVSLWKSYYMVGEDVNFEMTSDTGNVFTLGIDDEYGNRLYTYDTGFDNPSTAKNYTKTFNKAGKYSCWITAYNDAGRTDSERFYFTIYDEKPSVANVNLYKNSYMVGENVTFEMSSDSGFIFTLGIDDENGNRIRTYDTGFENVSTQKEYTCSFDTPGRYSCWITTGNIDSERVYFVVYDKAPEHANVDLWKHNFMVGEKIPFELSSDTGGVFTLGIDDKDGNRLHTYDTGFEHPSTHQTYQYTINEPGEYSCWLTTYNAIGSLDSERVYFTVYDKAPSEANVTLWKPFFMVGEEIPFDMSSDLGFVFTLGVDDVDGKRIYTYDTGFEHQSSFQTHKHALDTPGEYSCWITTYNAIGHMNSERFYFTVYDKAPSKASVKLEKNTFEVGENVDFNMSSDLGFVFTLGIDDADGNRLITYDTGFEMPSNNQTYFQSFEKPGDYICWLTTYNAVGRLNSEKVSFKILSSVIGDCNNDGELSVADAVLLQKWLLAVPDTELANWQAADLCEDGRLDVFDLCLMKRMLVENS